MAPFFMTTFMFFRSNTRSTNVSVVMASPRLPQVLRDPHPTPKPRPSRPQLPVPTSTPSDGLAPNPRAAGWNPTRNSMTPSPPWLLRPRVEVCPPSLPCTLWRHRRPQWTCIIHLPTKLYWAAWTFCVQHLRALMMYVFLSEWSRSYIVFAQMI